MLAIARSMMARPKLLLADEPSMGLSPVLVQSTFDILKKLRAMGTTILLVEQNARMALSVADRGYVLQAGRIVLSGKAKDLLDDQDVQRAYIGIAGSKLSAS